MRDKIACPGDMCDHPDCGRGATRHGYAHWFLACDDHVDWGNKLLDEIASVTAQLNKLRARMEKLEKVREAAIEGVNAVHYSIENFIWPDNSDTILARLQNALKDCEESK